MSSTDSIRRQFLIRFVAGGLLLIAMVYPASVGSQRAIRGMRNVPATWLPDSMPLKREFMSFVDRFAITDVLQVSWPGAHLGGRDVDRVVKLLRPLSATAGEQNRRERPLHRQVRQLCKSQYPIMWLRSGTEIRDALVKSPPGLSDRAARSRLTGSFLGRDRRQVAIMISLGPSAFEQHETLLRLMRHAIAQEADVLPEQVAMVGGPVDGAAVDAAAKHSIDRFALPASALAAVLCWFCLRSVTLSATIVAVAVVGQGLVLAVVHALGWRMNAVLIVLPPLVFVLTVSAGIHLSNYFLDTIKHATSEQRARSGFQTLSAQTAMRLATRPCLLAAFTTVVGLLSLTLVDLQPARVFGVVGAFGVLTTLSFLILMMPGAMVLSRIAGPSHDKGRGRFANWKIRLDWIVERPRILIVTFAAVTIVAAVGTTRLSTSVSVPNMFDAESDLRRGYLWFEREIGPTMTADVLLSYDPDASSDPLDELDDVFHVHAAVEGLGNVGGVTSAATFSPPVPHRKNIAATIKRTVIRKQLTSEHSAIRDLGYLTGSQSEPRVWRLVLRLYQTGDSDFDSKLRAIEEIVRSTSDDRLGSSVTLTGHLVIVQRSQEILLRDLFRSFLTALAVITVVMVLFLQNVLGGLIAMAPNIMPTLLMFGGMGWGGWTLDIGSVMTASVALGIAVDDSVHLLTRFRSNCSSPPGQHRAKAAIASLRQCGYAMMQTTLVCSLSLLVYGLSDFVPTRRFAWLMFALLAAAWLGVSLLLPAMMVTRLGETFCVSKFRPGERRSSNTRIRPEGEIPDGI